MRIVTFALASLVGLSAVPAFAYENFIPLGHNYAPDDPELPAFNSDQDRLNSRVDIIETENWVRQRNAKAFRSQMDRFSNEQELRGGDDFIDY